MSVPRFATIAVSLLCSIALVHSAGAQPAPSPGGEPTLEEPRSERLSLRDLGGDWRLVRTSWTRRVPDGVTVTARFSGDQVAGSGGCNRYSGGVRAGDPANGLRIGPVIATRMFCPAPRGETESDYLRKLEAVRSFGFLAGRLVLSYELDGESGSLVFERDQGREDGQNQD